MADASVAALETRLLRALDEMNEMKAANDAAWIIVSAALVIMMQLGFAMYEAGTVREHNVVATYAKNILDFVFGNVVATCFGYYVAYGEHAIAMTFEDGGHAHLFFYLAFQATASTIVSGAMAERTTVQAYMMIACSVDVLYSVAVRLVWGDGGFLKDLGFLDFAGAGIVHMLGGFSALVGATVVGPRHGRWDLALAADFVPHNIPSVMGGTLLLWVGWYGFNAGSTRSMSSQKDAMRASSSAMMTTISATTSTITALLYSLVRTQGLSVDILAVGNSILAGLVGISAGCDVIDAPFSAFTGVASCLVYKLASRARHAVGIDDVVDAFAVHGACGCWSCIAVGLFHREDGLITTGSRHLLGVQVAGCGCLSLLAVLPMLIITGCLRRFRLLRVSVDDESVGLDAEFGLHAYVTRSRSLQHCSDVSSLLRKNGYTPTQLLDALTSLRGIIYRPFTPQAADNKLQGEVRDILEHFEMSWPNRVRRTIVKHIAFLSHHKADAGDAVRIFHDTAQRQLTSQTFGRASELADLNLQAECLLFLDSSGLKDLQKLLSYVQMSANYVLFLSKSVLERPWVLAELTAAHSNGNNICVVLMEFPGKQDDPKAFAFPRDLERVIAAWTFYIAKTSKPKKNFSRLLPRSKSGQQGGRAKQARSQRHGGGGPQREQSTLPGDPTLGVAPGEPTCVVEADPLHAEHGSPCTMAVEDGQKRAL